MLETIGRYFDPWEAHIVRARLEAEDIPAFVVGDQHMILNWPICIALGGARLQVPPSFAQAAENVIEKYESGIYQDDLLEEFSGAVETCPKCGTDKIVSTVPYSTRALVVLTTVVASAPFPASATLMSCSKCSHRWRYAP